MKQVELKALKDENKKLKELKNQEVVEEIETVDQKREYEQFKNVTFITDVFVHLK